MAIRSNLDIKYSQEQGPNKATTTINKKRNGDNLQNKQITA